MGGNLIVRNPLFSAVDTTPDAFSFTDLTNVPINQVTTSSSVTIAGMSAGASAAVTVTGGTADINGSGSFSSSPGSVFNGDTVRARGTSSGSLGVAVNVVVTINGISDTFTITTGTPGTQLGANLTGSAYYSTHKFYINMIQDDGGGHGWWEGTTQDDNAHPQQDQFGRIIGLPAGHFAKHGYGILGGMDRLYGYIRTGSYVMRHTGGGKITLQDASPNITNIVQASNGRVTFDVGAPSNSTNINFWVENITGGTINVDCTNTLICRAGLEAAWDAGDRFLPEALAFYAHYKVLRMMDVIGTVGSRYRMSSEVPTAAQFMWGAMPPELCARFCVLVGAELWLNLPAPVQHLKSYSCNPATDTIQFKQYYGANLPLPADFATGDQVFFQQDQVDQLPMFAGQDGGPYYIRDLNPAAGTFRISLTSGGAFIDLTADISGVPEYKRMITKYYDPLPLWRTFYSRVITEAPTLKIWIEFADEVGWNFGDPWRSNWYWLFMVGSYLMNGSRTGAGGPQSLGYITLLMLKTAQEFFARNKIDAIYPGQHANVGTITGIDYVDVTNLAGLGATKKVYEVIDSVCVTSYITMADNGGVQDIPMTTLITNHAESWTDAQIEAGFNRSLANIQTWQTAWNTQKNARNSALKMLVYEGCVGLGWPTEVTNITVNPIGTLAVGDTITGQTTGTKATVLFISGTTVQFLDSTVIGGTGYFDTGAYPTPGENILKGGVVQGICAYSGRPLNDPVDTVTQRLISFVYGAGGANVRNAWAQYHTTNNIALVCNFPGCATFDVTEHSVITINGMAENWDTPNSYTAFMLASFLKN